MNWRDAGNLYAALVGFSIGAWLVVIVAFIQEIRGIYVDGKRSIRLPLGLTCWVFALSIYATAVATAINNPRSDIPVWRLTLYWVALFLADAGIGLMAWHVRRHGLDPDIRRSPTRARRSHDF